MNTRKLTASQKNVSSRQYLRKVNLEIQKLNGKLEDLIEIKELLEV